MSEAAFHYLALAALGDGAICAREQEALLRGAQVFEVSPLDATRLIEELRSDESPELPPLEPEQQDAVLAQVVDVIMADGVLKPSERSFLARVGDAFGVKAAALNALCARARETRSSGKPDADGLVRPIPKGSEFSYKTCGREIRLGQKHAWVSGGDLTWDFALDSVQAIHLRREGQSYLCCLDLRGAPPLRVASEGADWKYVRFLALLHKRLEGQPANKVRYLQGDSSNHRSRLGYLLGDALAGGLTAWAAMWLWGWPAAVLVGVGVLLASTFHVRALRSHSSGQYDPRKIPASVLPGGLSHPEGFLVVTTLIFLLQVAVSDD